MNPFAVTKSGTLGDSSRDSRFVATVGTDDTVHISNLAELRQHLDNAWVSPHRSHPRRHAPSDPRRPLRPHSDRKLVTVAGDGAIRVWQLDTSKLLEAARRVAGRNLTRDEWKQYFPGLEYTRTFPDLPEASAPEDGRCLRRASLRTTTDRRVTPTSTTDQDYCP